MVLVIGFHSVLFTGLAQIFWSHRDISGLSQFDQWLAHYLWALAGMGRFGVDLFFVLSAYLMTEILVQTKTRPGYYASFFARRALRIFPLYYVVLALALVLLPRIGAPVEHPVWFWTYSTNFLLARGWDQAPTELHHLWSLAIEEQFYLIWPFLVRALSRERLILLASCAFCASTLVRIALYAAGDPQSAYMLTFARLDPIAVGALIALISREPHGRAHLARIARAASPVLLLLVSLMALWRGTALPDPVLGTIGLSLIALLFGAGLVQAITAERGTALHRALTTRPLRVLGRYSYALYIFHQPVVHLIGMRAGVDLWLLPSFPGQVLVGVLAVSSLAFGGALGLALLSWRVIEAPMLGLKRYFPRPGSR